MNVIQWVIQSQNEQADDEFEGDECQHTIPQSAEGSAAFCLARTTKHTKAILKSLP